MRVTVCELPHESRALSAAWSGLCRHVLQHRSQLVLLPEFASAEPVWERARFDQARWDAAIDMSDALLEWLPDLGIAHVVGTRPVTVDERRLNEGFLWSRAAGYSRLRSKSLLPDEPGGWEARWFERGDRDFPAFEANGLSFGLNICSELWALDTFGNYAAHGTHAILTPRATAAATMSRWLALGTVAALRSGAFSISSNRVDPEGACGGVGWIISPRGEMLARTAPEWPFATVDIDLDAPAAARADYPCSIFPRDSGAAA